MVTPKIHCKYDKLVPIRDLKGHPKNRNKHSSDQIDRLAELFQFHGIRHPVIVSKRSGHIVAGHGRRDAAAKLKLKEFPVVYQNFADGDAEYAFLQADNAIALWAELDLDAIRLDVPNLSEGFNLDMLGIKGFSVEDGESKGLCDEDEIPEKVPAKTKLGDIYQLGRHRLLCGDSTSEKQIEKLMDGKKVDMVFTDPPYGIAIVKNGHVGITSKGVRRRRYREIEGDDVPFDPSFILNMESDVKILWGANHYASRLPDSSQWLIWDKKIESGTLDGNNFSDCELAWTDSKAKSCKTYRHTWAGMLRSGDRKEELKDRVHPTQKPVGLCVSVMDDFSEKGMCILDLFGGSGSTLIACEKTDRRCFMMEIDPHYCDVIVARWEKYTGKSAALITKDKQMMKVKRG